MSDDKEAKRQLILAEQVLRTEAPVLKELATSDKTADQWVIAMASAVEVIRGYAVMMENGDVPMLRGPLALLNVARVIESTPRRHQS